MSQLLALKELTADNLIVSEEVDSSDIPHTSYTHDARIVSPTSTGSPGPAARGVCLGCAVHAHVHVHAYWPGSGRGGACPTGPLRPGLRQLVVGLRGVLVGSFRQSSEVSL